MSAEDTRSAGAMPGAVPRSFVSLTADVWTTPFWEAAAEHRLVCARCAECGRHRMPPSPFCPVCRSQALVWDELNGRGTIFSFTVVRHAVIPAVAEYVPNVIAVVDLDDAPNARLVANVVEADPSAVRIGAPVKVVWDDCAEGVTVPRVVLS